MKHKLILSVIFFLLPILPVYSWEYEIGGGVKYFDPSDELFSEFYGPGPSYGLVSHFWRGTGLGLIFDLSYFNARRTYMGDKYLVEAYSFSPALAYYFPEDEKLIPYLGIGFTLCYSIERNMVYGKSVDDFDLAYQVNAGIEFKLRRVRPYFQMAFRSIPGEEEGINLSGWLTEIGIQVLLNKPKQTKPSPR